MSKKRLLIVFLLLTCLFLIISAQNNNKISKTSVNSTAKNVGKNCQVFLSGKILSQPKPVYPIEAKSANVRGKVEVAVEIDEKGNVVSIESVNGNDLLKNSAIQAAKQAKFTPPTCDGVPTKTIGIITYNFAPVAMTANYFTPTKIEDFTDITVTDNFYEDVLYLTENYKIAFGYADGKFHGEMPLTKGDFAYFLRQMLDLLNSRAKFAKLNIAEISLYKTYNPLNLTQIEFNPTEPFANSMKTLSDDYGIVLADKNGFFNGNSALTQNEVIEIWRKIFGNEAVPVNFVADSEKSQTMSRGDFATFLNESLEFLTYKILP